MTTCTILALVYRDGIVFALSRPDGDDNPLSPPPNLEFLLVLSEFSPRLLEVDRTGKKGVAVYLQGQLEEKMEGRVDWEALRAYQGSLGAREKDTADPSALSTHHTKSCSQISDLPSSAYITSSIIKAIRAGVGWV